MIVSERYPLVTSRALPTGNLPCCHVRHRHLLAPYSLRLPRHASTAHISMNPTRRDDPYDLPQRSTASSRSPMRTTNSGSPARTTVSPAASAKRDITAAISPYQPSAMPPQLSFYPLSPGPPSPSRYGANLPYPPPGHGPAAGSPTPPTFSVPPIDLLCDPVTLQANFKQSFGQAGIFGLLADRHRRRP